MEFSLERLRRKLTILADAAKYDASCASSGGRREARAGALGTVTGEGICHSFTPDGRCVSLLKILLTNYCVYDCAYCVNRSSSDVPRARFTPGEVATLTMELYRRNYIEGLFLSSGIAATPDGTSEELIEAARLLREQHGFRGYIHLKIVAGTSAPLVMRAGRYADRLSANIELPTQSDLDRLAPEKTHASAEAVMSEVRSHKQEAPAFAPAGQSTQLIVGATSSTDADILKLSNRLYRQHLLRRVYYTAYSPSGSADGRLPPVAPPLLREHRLYQADWLSRQYGFEVGELTTEDQPNLALDLDPKEAWAVRNRHRFPVDVNRAERELLLRIPGMGVRSVERLVRARRHRRLTLADLQRLRVVLRRAQPFVVTADVNPALAGLDRVNLAQRLRPPRQLSLFEASQGARTGEL